MTIYHEVKVLIKTVTVGEENKFQNSLIVRLKLAGKKYELTLSGILGITGSQFQ